MRKKQPVSYYLMLTLTIAFTVLAIVTLLPNPAASKPNILGYRSICPFAPAATAVCCLLAGLCCTLRNRFIAASAAANRRGPWIAPIGLLLIFGSIALWGGFSYLRVQSIFSAQIAQLKMQATSPANAPVSDGMREAAALDGEVAAKVRVKVAAGTIIGVELLEGRNIDAALADALGKRIIEQQSCSIDAISGATVSSAVFLQAVDKALRP